MSSPPSDQSRWFVEEVHPHEPSLKAYLRGAFPAVHDVDDVVQESYLRIWRARIAHPIGFSKAFLFRIAQHVALDLIRRRRASPIDPVGDLGAVPVIEDKPDAAETITLNEKINLLADAVATLPPRCRQVTMLRKLRGLSQKEIAAQLGISEKTVEEQAWRGVKRCEEYLRRRGVSGLYKA